MSDRSPIPLFDDDHPYWWLRYDSREQLPAVEYDPVEMLATVFGASSRVGLFETTYEEHVTRELKRTGRTLHCIQPKRWPRELIPVELIGTPGRWPEKNLGVPATRFTDLAEWIGYR